MRRAKDKRLQSSIKHPMHHNMFGLSFITNKEYTKIEIHDINIDKIGVGTYLILSLAKLL